MSETLPQTTEDASEPRISVLLPTTLPWPVVESSLSSLLSQDEAPSFEILVLDGHGAALQSPPVDRRVRWLAFPGADSFALRAEGLAAARGGIIAITEDHCIAPADWLASVAAAHRRDASAAIVGVTVNHPDAAVSAMDRANFALTFAGQNGKRIDVGVRRLPVPTNVSFKRASLPESRFEPGHLEYVWLDRLGRENRLAVSRSVVLKHRQLWGRAAIAVHHASGRSYGACVRSAGWRQRLLWGLMLPILPWRLIALAAPDLLGGAAGSAATPADCLCLLALIFANISGQFLGVTRGAGMSRRSL